MKKIIVLASIVLAATVSQAASVKWSYSVSANEKNNHIYLVVGSALPTEIADFSTWIGEQTVVSDKAVSYSSMTKKSSASLESTSETITKDKTYYFVMVDAAGENFKAIGTYAGTAIVYDTDNQESAINTPISDAFTAAEWKAIGGSTPTPDPAIPEPTSGLLMLVGLGALALRRRR